MQHAIGFAVLLDCNSSVLRGAEYWLHACWKARNGLYPVGLVTEYGAKVACTNR